MTRAILALAVVALARPAAAAADADPGARRHQGWQLRLDLGGGYVATSWRAAGADMTWRGPAGQVGVAGGYAFRPDVVLSLHAWGIAAPGPQLVGAAGTQGTDSSTVLALGGIGPELTVFVAPVDLFFSLTPSVTRVSLKHGGVTGATEAGFGLHAEVGKAWWIADHWWLGVAAQGMYSTNTDRGSAGPQLGTIAGGLALSVAYGG